MEEEGWMPAAAASNPHVDHELLLLDLLSLAGITRFARGWEREEDVKQCTQNFVGGVNLRKEFIASQILAKLFVYEYLL